MANEMDDILAEEGEILTDLSGFDADFQAIKDLVANAQPQIPASVVREVHDKLDAIKAQVAAATAQADTLANPTPPAPVEGSPEEEAAETPDFETAEDAPPA